MSDENKNGSFWPSYVDIMTTLFAIMLVLFAVSYSRFKVKEKELSVLADHFIEIIDIYDAVGNIDSTKFEYNNQYSKNIFKLSIEYKTKGYDLESDLKFDAKSDSAQRLLDDIYKAGESIKETIVNMQKKDNLKKDIKYLVVVEGQSSRIPYYEDEWRNNNTLSYLRSQYLVEYWKRKGLDFSKLDRCEIVICGSGEGGVPRYEPNKAKLDDVINSSILDYDIYEYMYNEFYEKVGKTKKTSLSAIKKTHPKEYKILWNSMEERNQRFLIHIVPVIGQLDMDVNIRELVDKYRNND